MVQLIGDKAMNRILSHHEAVQWKVTETTEEIGRKAEALLAEHRNTGEASIETSYGETDGFVSLADEAADSIEFGHLHNKSGKWVEGIHVVARASEII